MATDSLPDYEQPPVTETVLGGQFEPLTKLKHAHLGAFWQALGSKWKNLQETSAIEPQFEKFTESSRWGSPRLQLKLAEIPPIRIQIRNESNDRMIQVAVNFHLKVSIPRDVWAFAVGGWFIWPMRAGELSVGAIATPVQTANCQLPANGRFPREHSIA